MATVASALVPKHDVNIIKYVWLNMANGDDGSPRELPAFADRSVQVVGTWGAGGELSIEGSNDGGTTWAVLSDPLGRALAFTANDIQNITEISELIRPRVTGGDGTTLISVYFFAKKAG